MSSQLRADGYLAGLAETLDADVQAIRRDFAAWRSRERRRARGETTERVQETGVISGDLFLMLAVAANRGLFPLVRNSGIALLELDDERARALFVALEESFRADETGFDAFCAHIEDPVLRDLVVQKTASGEFDLNQEKMVRDGVRRVRERELRRKIDQLGTELRNVEREKPDPARLRELLAEKMHLDSELAKMNTRAAGA